MKKHLVSSFFTALCALAFFSSPAAGQTIINPSFETDAVPPLGFGPITGWIGGSGLDDGTKSYANNGTIPDGQKVAFILGSGTIHQVVSGFTPGLQYRLRYFENARISPATPNVQVTVGGVTVVASHAVPAVGGSNPYAHKTSEPFMATAASMDVAFVVTGSGDLCALLDNVEIGRNLVVTTLANGQAGSLRQAVLDAPPGSIITFDVPPLATISLSSQITIDKNLSIVGPGATQLTLRNVAARSPTSRLFLVETTAPVAISGLTLTDGAIPGALGVGGGGISVSGNSLTLTDVTISNCSAGDETTDANGGGINGRATLNQCTISNNSAALGAGIWGGGAINNSFVTGNSGGAGAGVHALFPTTINNSTISNNTSLGDGLFFTEGGGGLWVGSTVTVTNTTISNNQTISRGDLSQGVQGGGIYVDGGSLTLINSTVTNNAARNMDPPASPSKGGGIYLTAGTLTMRNSILAGNTVDNSAITFDFGPFGSISSQGHNLIGRKGPATITGDTTGNIVGTDAAPVLAQLAPLGFYGGPTYTHALLTTSPAINAGNTANSPTADQRGAARIGTADIGAFELNNTANAGTYVAILPQAVLTAPYTFTLVPNNVAFGSTFTYTVTSGALPGGFSLTTASNVVTLAGTPTTAGTFNFAITASNGTITNVTSYRLTVPLPGPTVISPVSGDTFGGNAVTITGTGFTGATAVSIGGTPVLSFAVQNDTSIRAVTAAHVAGPASVLVSIAGNGNAANTLYTYLAAYTQTQYDANRTAGQNDVISAPNTYNLFTATQYSANYTAGQNNVLSSPNSFNLYTLSQVQALNVDVPLLTRDSTTGKFKLTMGVRKSTNLATVPFSDFPMNGAGMTTVINAQGKVEFVFPVTDNAAFFRVQAQ